MNLMNKKVIITGGSMGIGRALAEYLAENGATLFLIARHEKDLQETCQNLSRGYDQSHQYFYADVGNRKEIEKTVNNISLNNDYIDALINCAGIYGPIGKIGDLNLDAFEDTIKINLLGTLYTCFYCLPLLEKAKRGKIVNLVGGGASSAFPFYSAYATSKIGVARLTENMALEYKDQNIDINAVAPGFVITRLHQETINAGEKAGKEFLKKTLAEIEKGGAGTEKTAHLTAFLLSTKADGITGKLISAVWDPWDEEEFQNKLRADKDFATLRRIDDKYFSSI